MDDLSQLPLSVKTAEGGLWYRPNTLDDLRDALNKVSLYCIFHSPMVMWFGVMTLALLLILSLSCLMPHWQESKKCCIHV